jgi:hypothetical protein
MKHLALTLLSIIFISSCSTKSYELHYDHENIVYLDRSQLPDLQVQQEFYVPAYSDIYYETWDRITYLTVILSIRNISFNDTLYIDRIDYFGSTGNLLRSYTKGILMLRPMESMEYIVESAEQEGGAGANFIVRYKAVDSVKNPPLVETVMMGNLDNYRFAFTSRAVEIR